VKKILTALLLLTLIAPARGQDLGSDAYKRGDYAAAIEKWRPLAEQGHADFQSVLGDMYAAGQGVAQDYGEAEKWLRLAAEQGVINAQNALGLMYRKGEGVLQDFVEAVKWYRLASEQGSAEAQFYLGAMHFVGAGVPEDHVRAYMWLNLAAAQRHKDAIEMRVSAAKAVTSAQTAAAQRLAREWLAAFEKRKSE